MTLDFRVPAHRMFPEREEPWVLARILRQAGPAAEAVEAGAILEAEGFAFGAPLSWSDRRGRRRVLSSTVWSSATPRDAVARFRSRLAVSWEQVARGPCAA